MKILKAFVQFILALLKAILYQWAIFLAQLWKWLLEIFRRGHEGKRLPRDERKASRQHCEKLSDPAYKRPDPLIYAQYYLMAQGIAVTWDNPDITLLKGGVTIADNFLEANTEYEIVARIWNNSTEAPIIDLPVDFWYLSFGMGITANAITQTKVNLGVKGGPGHPAFASVKWTSPAVAGHYCLITSFFWMDDENPNNNLGQKNLMVAEMRSPAEFRFELYNNAQNREIYHFEVDTYTIPPPRNCNDERGKRNIRTQKPREIPGTVQQADPVHNRANYPLPEGWTVTFVPATPVLMPGQQMTIDVTVTAPESFHGSKHINIHGFNQAGAVAGGISAQVIRK